MILDNLIYMRSFTIIKNSNVFEIRLFLKLTLR
jgi:hypothetical protein